MVKFVISIDQGTSSTRCIIFSREGKVVCSSQKEHQQIYSQKGWNEHDGEEIWLNAKTCVIEAMALSNLTSNDIAAVGITNQRETSLIWNRHTGQLYHNAIVWNDTRTTHIVESYCNKEGKGNDRWRTKTGLPLATYFSWSKIVYMLETVPGLLQDAQRGDAMFGTIDSWLIWKLSGGTVHTTDVTNASRTGLMNLETLAWDESILSDLGIPKCILPNILSSSEVFCHVASSNGDSVCNYGITELVNVPIAGVLGDQHAALFGQTCFEAGQAKCTYGTGAFLLMNTGHTLVHSKRGLLTTVAYKLGKDAAAVYCLEGAVAYCGSSIQWLRDNLKILPSADISESMARQVPNNGGVYFVPAFAGLYAPYWRMDARGIIAGLTAFNTSHHIVRAALEATAFQVCEVLDAMRLDSSSSGVILKGLNVDGGMVKNDFLMQFQSDMIDAPLASPSVIETTALGAAFAAGLAVGMWKDMQELKSIWQLSKGWKPTMDKEERNLHMKFWHKAIARSFLWEDSSDERVGKDIYLSLLPRDGAEVENDARANENVEKEKEKEKKKKKDDMFYITHTAYIVSSVVLLLGISFVLRSSMRR